MDGGIWANNPIMIALVDALACFSMPRGCIRILSLGCGSDNYTVSGSKLWPAGRLAWHDIIVGAMRFQSQNVIGQAGLLIGADRVTRVAPPRSCANIELDDWMRSVEHLPGAATVTLEEQGDRLASGFLRRPAELYTPCTPRMDV